MPNLRIDSHQHFWERERGDYGWLTVDLGPIYRDFTPIDLALLLADNRVDKTVVVQAAPTVAETEYLLGLAEKTDFIAGVVGWVDMEASNAVTSLDILRENPYFKGVRPMIQEIADPQWMLTPKLDTAFQHLVKTGLCFDALVNSVHLPHLLTLLQRYPGLKTVVDHGAKPDIANGRFDEWAAGISAIAEMTDAMCKLSGLLTEAQQGAGYAELEPYIRHLLNHFGPERLMWGSDWPVLTLANDYTGWVNMTEKFLASLGDEHRSQIMGGNAARFYSLSDMKK